MAKLALVLDTRSGNGTFPLKVRISTKKTKSYIGLGIKLTPEQWNEEEGKVVDHKDEKTLNLFIENKIALAKSVLVKLDLQGVTDNYSANELRDIIENNGVIKEETTQGNFLVYYLARMEKMDKRKTRLSNDTTIKKMMQYDPLLADKTFEDIDVQYIEELDAFWENQGLAVNSRAVYFRNIRAVFNRAIDDELTKNYPFRKFSIKKTPTKKRNLSLEELRLLKDYPIQNEFQEKYRDLFMLMFYMRGINAVDIFALKKSNIRAGRINYIRSKTGKAYSVKIEPEMQVILNRYKGVDYLLDVCDGATNRQEYEVKYEGFLQRMDRGLKKIGPYERKGLGGKKTIKPILPGLSQYWCRHTTATLMSDMGVSNDFIACSLGHENGNKTTNIYIEYNQKEVDKANRDLIDYVNGKKDVSSTK
jgi:integrase